MSDQLLIPVATSLVSGVLVLLGGFFAYLYGRKRNQAEIQKLQSEKESIEAAAGLSTAQASSIIATAAAEVVQPLTNRIKELQGQVATLTQENVMLRNTLADLEAQIALLRQRDSLAGNPHELHHTFLEGE